MSRKTLFCFFLLAAFSLLAPAVGRAVDASECNTRVPQRPILLTGIAGFTYDLVGKAIAAAYNQEAPPDKQITVCPSEGSLQNVQKLSSHEATFALVQSDVAHAVWYSHPLVKSDDACYPFSAELQDDSGNLQLITPLYAEVLHVLVRPHLNVSSLADPCCGSSGMFVQSEEFTEKQVGTSAIFPFSGRNQTPLPGSSQR